MAAFLFVHFEAVLQLLALLPLDFQSLFVGIGLLGLGLVLVVLFSPVAGTLEKAHIFRRGHPSIIYT